MIKLRTVFKTDDYLVFLCTMGLFGTATGLFMGVLNNYLAEILSVSRFGRGVVEFLREFPGLSLIFLLALLHRHSETRIIRLALLVSMLGLFGLLAAGSRFPLAVLCIVLWSTGEHLLMPVRDSIAIHSAYAGREGRAMGLTVSFSNIGQVAGYYCVPLVFLLVNRLVPAEAGRSATLPFQAVFAVSAVFLTLGILLSARFHKSAWHVRKERLYVRRKYLRYYILEMFYGARKQVFLTFAPFVLILNYGASTELIATLYGVYSTINVFFSPAVGRLVDKAGYRIVLIVDAILLVALCILYGFSHRWFPPEMAYRVVCAVFVLDGMLFVVGMSRSLYARTISENQSELTSTLSTGISINHLVSIGVALLGGWLWEGLGIETLFLCAAGFGVGAMVFSYLLPRGEGTAPTPP